MVYCGMHLFYPSMRTWKLTFATNCVAAIAYWMSTFLILTAIKI